MCQECDGKDARIAELERVLEHSKEAHEFVLRAFENNWNIDWGIVERTAGEIRSVLAKAKREGEPKP